MRNSPAVGKALSASARFPSGAEGVAHLHGTASPPIGDNKPLRQNSLVITIADRHKGP